MADDEKSAFDPGLYEEEAGRRWGHTDAYKESARRAKGYSKDDWARIKGESEDIEARMAALMRAGIPADGEEATAVAEEARLHIHRWFYPCSHGMHAGLAEMYTADPRFRAHYDERVEGLADYVAQAIRANAARETRDT
ncbi:MAG: TipAS antibiotic-recognition domain-containing protein [Gemmatimonadetes bacterium]|nr:TipAS antibiotic-recognition domain-containing protein [Gemmatimonadota bacterium]